jgi:hypothetical protein
MMHSGRAAAICFALALLLLAWLLLGGCSAKITVPAAGMADLATTKVALDRGLSEGNPLFRDASFGTMAAWKAGATLLIVGICQWLDDHGYQKHSDVLQWLATGAWSVAAASNIYQIQKGGDDAE